MCNGNLPLFQWAGIQQTHHEADETNITQSGTFDKNKAVFVWDDEGIQSHVYIRWNLWENYRIMSFSLGKLTNYSMVVMG